MNRSRLARHDKSVCQVIKVSRARELKSRWEKKGVLMEQSKSVRQLGFSNFIEKRGTLREKNRAGVSIVMQPDVFISKPRPILK